MTGLVGTMRVFNHHVNVGYTGLTLSDFLWFLVAGFGGSELLGWLQTGEFAPLSPELIPQALIFAPVSLLAMVSMGLYEPRLREGANGVLLRTMGACALTTVAVTVLFYLLPPLKLLPGALMLTSALGFSGALLNRALWTRVIDLDQLQRKVLVLGSGNTAAAISSKMRRRADRRGFRIVGYVRSNGEDTKITREPLITLDSPLSDYARDHDIDEIVVALEERRSNVPQEELLRCRGLGIRVTDVVDFFEREAGKVLIAHAHPSWFTYGGGFQSVGDDPMGKRLFDVTASFLLLSIAWPFMLLTILAIWLEDGFGAPVFYKQRRVGRNGRVFEVIKFRSMSVNAEGDGKARWATNNDPRVTRVGAFIRKARIDELPQIINVMNGDMAFVGPRPERPEFVRELTEQINYYEKRHYVKPGITGWAQTNYPYGASIGDTENKLEFDLYYVKNRSLFLDALVLLQTAEVILFSKGSR